MAQTLLQKSSYSPFYTLQSAVGWFGFQAPIISLGLAENSSQEQAKLSKNKIVTNFILIHKFHNQEISAERERSIA
jgi:hypothetical protein